MTNGTPSTTDNSISNAITTQMSNVNEQLVSTVERLSKVAEKGPVNLMLAMGAFLIIFSMLLKIEIAGHRISNLGTAEFITLVIVGAIILIASAAIRLYQFYVSVTTIIKDQQKLGADIVKQVTNTATEIIKQKPPEIVL